MKKTTHARETVELASGALRIAVVSDTHGKPHDMLDARLDALAPELIMHAGDIGELGVLDALALRARVIAVRGNVDGRAMPDFVTIDVRDAGASVLRILLTHYALAGPKLLADVARVAEAEGASLVVCGHSHVPFAGRDRGLTVFNSGSVGPRRFRLPIVFGVIEIGASGVSLRHVDCETGEAWRP